MTHDPRTQDEVYESLKESLVGKITKLSNFTDRSFNYVWTQAFAEEVRELEVLALTSALAGFIDFTGGPITQDQLENLDLGDSVSADEINEKMDDQYLDEFVKIVGITRLPGSRATGSVTITTQSEPTTIDKGTVLTTRPDQTGQKLRFETTEQASTNDGITTVTDVGIQAVEIGEEYNVPANTINRFNSPPVGVRGVDNPESTTGGEPEETNDELRERAKAQLGGASEGGTTEGIKSYIRSNVEGVRVGDVLIEEFVEGGDGPGGKAPYVDVIVDGGTDQDVLDAIEFSRPTGMRHELIRPQVIQLGIRADLDGTDINVDLIENEIEDTLLDLGIGEDGYKDQYIQSIMNRDEDIESIELFDATYDRVTNERFRYDTSKAEQHYRLDFTYENENGSVTITDEDGNSYDEGTDFNVVDQSGDGWPETVEWDTNETTPETNNTEQFFVDYDVTTPATLFEDRYQTELVRDESNKFTLGKDETIRYDTGAADHPFYRLSDLPFEGSTEITDGNNNTYTEGTDYDLRSVGYGEGQDKFTFVKGQERYYLTSNIYEIVSVKDENGVGYTQGDDYELEDTNGNGRDDTIVWDLNKDTPTDSDGGLDFTVKYVKDNGLRQHIDWSQTFFEGAVADDGGTQTTETSEAQTVVADSMTLLPSESNVAVGDAYYFGGSEKFDDVELEISTPGEGTWNIVWQYWDGSSWVSLSNQTNLTDNTDGFQKDGVNKIEFGVPSNWSTTSVNGVSGLYWIRAKLDSFNTPSGDYVQPLGQLARRDTSGNHPNDNENFTVTYDVKGYTTEYEVVGTPDGEIVTYDEVNDNKVVYDEGNKYEIIDYDEDDENEIIHWLENPSTLDDGEQFFFTYLTEGDTAVNSREKLDPSDRIRIKVSDE